LGSAVTGFTATAEDAVSKVANIRGSKWCSLKKMPAQLGKQPLRTGLAKHKRYLLCAYFLRANRAQEFV
jgi:hypothetical protein